MHNFIGYDLSEKQILQKINELLNRKRAWLKKTMKHMDRT